MSRIICKSKPAYIFAWIKWFRQETTVNQIIESYKSAVTINTPLDRSLLLSIEAWNFAKYKFIGKYRKLVESNVRLAATRVRRKMASKTGNLGRKGRAEHFLIELRSKAIPILIDRLPMVQADVGREAKRPCKKKERKKERRRPKERTFPELPKNPKRARTHEPPGRNFTRSNRPGPN